MSPIQKKICLLGDFAVGKTSLVRRFVEGVFEDKYLTRTSRNQRGFSQPVSCLLSKNLGG